MRIVHSRFGRTLVSAVVYLLLLTALTAPALQAQSPNEESGVNIPELGADSTAAVGPAAEAADPATQPDELGPSSTQAGPGADVSAQDVEAPAAVPGELAGLGPDQEEAAPREIELVPQLFLPLAQSSQDGTAGVDSALTSGAAGATHGLMGDFNGDGREDLAVGVPFEDIGAIINAGAVHVFYGSPLGLNTVGTQFWSQNAGGVLETSDTGDLFGNALAVGNFNGDNFDDLAIGVPLEDVGAIANAGAVAVLYGSPAGLTSVGNQFWSQDTAGIGGVSEAGDEFGWALTAGDFNNTGQDALAIGVPFEDLVAAGDNRGAVNVIYGIAAGGLNAAGNQVWTQDSAGILDATEVGDDFGYVLASGDFNGNNFDDLAVGVPFEDVGAAANAGAVNVVYGAAGGLNAAGNQFWFEDSAGIVGVSEAGDDFGLALAAGDFSNTGQDDLAIGAPFEDLVAAGDNRGSVTVIYGLAGGGLNAAGNQAWTQDSAGILDLTEVGDQFGSALVSADFNGNGFDDLAIGVPLEDVGAVANAGAVSVIYGAAGALNSAGNQFWSQDSAGILDLSETSDTFGRSLSAGNFNTDGHDDLAVGVPLEDIGAIADAGAVNVIYGSAASLTSVGNQFWNQDTGGVPDLAEAGDEFGLSN